jgi:hypothetical protein
MLSKVPKDYGCYRAKVLGWAMWKRQDVKADVVKSMEEAG